MTSEIDVKKLSNFNLICTHLDVLIDFGIEPDQEGKGNYPYAKEPSPVAVVVNIFGVFSEFGHRQFDFFVAIFINVVYQFGLKELGKVDGN